MIFFILFTQVAFAGTKIVQTATKDHLNLLKEVDKRYQSSGAIKFDVEKKDVISALDKSREFVGQAWLKKGKLRLELTSKDSAKDESIIVIDGKNIWLVSLPPKEFKKAKTQVIKASATSERAQKQGLLQILNQGGVLKYFTVYGVYPEGDEITYFLNPSKKSLELKKAQIIVNSKDKTISGLIYWDTNDNETHFKFSDTSFDTNINDKLLSYSPPKDADVMSY